MLIWIYLLKTQLELWQRVDHLFLLSHLHTGLFCPETKCLWLAQKSQEARDYFNTIFWGPISHFLWPFLVNHDLSLNTPAKPTKHRFKICRKTKNYSAYQKLPTSLSWSWPRRLGHATPCPDQPLIQAAAIPSWWQDPRWKVLQSQEIVPRGLRWTFAGKAHTPEEHTWVGIVEQAKVS